MNSPVAPQSTRAKTDFFSAVSVVSISTFNFNNVGFSSVAVMTNFWGKDLSHFGQQVWTEEVADGRASIHNVFEKKVVDGTVSICDSMQQGSGFCMS